MEQRQEHFRHPFNLSVRWKTRTGKWQTGSLQNLGRGGLCLLADKSDLEINEIIELELSLDISAHSLVNASYDLYPLPLDLRLNRTLKVPGRICWRKQEGSQKLYGLTFVDRDDDNWHLLCDYLHEQEIS